MLSARLRDTSIGRKLATLAGVAGLAFLALSVLFVLSWRDLEKASSRTSTTYVPVLRDAAEALVSLSSISTELFRYVNQIEPSAYRVRDALARARGALQRIDGADTTDEVRRDVQALLPLFVQIDARMQQLTRHLQADRLLESNDAHSWIAAEAGTMLQVVERVNGELWNRIVEENRAGARQSMEHAALAFALGLLFIAGALLYMVLVRRDLERGFDSLQEAVRRYTEGESDRIPSLERRDEIGQLSSFIDRLSTQVKESDQRLKDQLKFINDVLDSVPLSLALRDTEGRFKMINRTWEQYFGISTREQILGRTLQELRPGEEIAHVLAADRAAIERGPDAPPEPMPVVFRGRHYLQTRTAIANAEGNVLGVLITGLDVTAQHEMQQALETQRQRLELVTQASQVGVLDWDAASTATWYSPRYKAILGFPADADTSAWTFFDRVHPDDEPRVRAAFVAHLKGLDAQLRDSPQVEYRVRHADGSYIWVHGIGMSQRDAAGRSVRFVASITDISARRAQEEALRTQEQRLALVVRASKTGIIDWDGVTRKGWYSDRLKVMLGFAADADLSDWIFFDAVHPEDKDAMYQGLVATLKGERGSDTLIQEYRMRRDDGSYVWVQGMGLAVRGADGRTARFLASITDITERRTQEDALREQMELTRDLIRALPNPLFLKDEQFRFVHVNPAWEKVAAVPADKAIGRVIPEVYPPEYAEEFLAQDRALLAQGAGIHSIEVSIPGRKGPRQYILSKSLLRREDGSLRGMIGSMTDITRLKRTEAELRASREEALQAAQAKAAFLAAMSHEIRTPLNGVLGMAGLLADTELSGEQRDYVETVRVSGDALLSVINDILDYSKIESGRMELEREPMQPARAVEEAMEILGERARGKRLELIAELDDGAPEWVSGDFARLRQVLVNLVGNAVKFTERGEIVVKVTAQADAALRLEVSDTGIGIAPDRLEALFQPFTQADVSTTRKYGGTGLGLAISRRLVALMGGSIAARSEPGRGSTFTVSVPAQPCARPEGLVETSEPVDLAGRRILIVDDNATNLRILRRQLERWGATPVAAASPEAALEIVKREERIDVVLLDYHMPGMDGVMLARAMKKRRKALPLVLLSSSMYRRAEEAEAGLFSAQLLKPVRQQSLREAIGVALTGKRVVAPRSGRRRGDAPQGARALRVLVVDDIEVNRRVAQLMLRKSEHESDSASSGAEAVERVAPGRYDLVLMDLQMPDVDGLEAMRRIRERLGAEAPRIVAMTANAMPGDRERCLAAGMDGYLAKPLDARELDEELRLTAAMPRRSEAPDPLVDVARLDALAKFDDDDRSMVRGVIAAFLRDAPRYADALRAAAKKGDRQALASAAHALKGAAANAGAKAVAALAGAIESAAPRGASAARVKPLHKLLEDTAAALKRFGA